MPNEHDGFSDIDIDAIFSQASNVTKKVISDPDSLEEVKESVKEELKETAKSQVDEAFANEVVWETAREATKKRIDQANIPESVKGTLKDKVDENITSEKVEEAVESKVDKDTFTGLWESDDQYQPQSTAYERLFNREENKNDKVIDSPKPASSSSYDRKKESSEEEIPAFLKSAKDRSSNKSTLRYHKPYPHLQADEPVDTRINIKDALTKPFNMSKGVNRKTIWVVLSILSAIQVMMMLTGDFGILIAYIIALYKIPIRMRRLADAGFKKLGIWTSLGSLSFLVPIFGFNAVYGAPMGEGIVGTGEYIVGSIDYSFAVPFLIALTIAAIYFFYAQTVNIIVYCLPHADDKNKFKVISIAVAVLSMLMLASIFIIVGLAMYPFLLVSSMR